MVVCILLSLSMLMMPPLVATIGVLAIHLNRLASSHLLLGVRFLRVYNVDLLLDEVLGLGHFLNEAVHV